MTCITRFAICLLYLTTAAQERSSAVRDAITCLVRMKRKVEAAPTNATASEHFKLSIIHLCERIRCETLTVVELGIYRGELTSVLSHLFQHVIAIDVIPHFQGAPSVVAQFGKQSRNVVFLNLDLYSDSWNIFSQTHADVVVIDALHDESSVLNDLTMSLRIPGVKWLAFHDYEYRSVNEIVDPFWKDGYLKCNPIGRLTQNPPEGMLCNVQKTWVPIGAADFFRRKEQWFGLFNANGFDRLKQTGLVADVSCVANGRDSSVPVRCLDPQSGSMLYTGTASLVACMAPEKLCHCMDWTWDSSTPWRLEFASDFQGALVTVPPGSKLQGGYYFLMRHEQFARGFDRLRRMINNGMLGVGFPDKATAFQMMFEHNMFS